MRSIRRLFHEREREPESGMTLIEVVVAMMVFAIIALGVAQSMLSILTLTRDNRSRTVATNLAAQQIDEVRAIENVFKVVSTVEEQPVDGVTYKISTSATWIDSSGTDTGCQTDGTALQHLRVKVNVTWGDKVRSAPVTTETIIAPRTKINDPTRGTILVRVTNALGEPAPNMPITVDKVIDGAALPTPDPTDAQGCSYILLVTPGTYKVGVSKSGYVDNLQHSPSENPTVVVAAGQSAAVVFQYDKVSKVKLNLASNRGTLNPKLPSTFDLSFFSANPLYQPQHSGGFGPEFALHPALAGYDVVTGKSASPTEFNNGCLSVDPLEWPSTRSGVATLATRAGPADALAGGSSEIDVPMAFVKITASGLDTNAKKTVKAVSAVAPPESDDPGCALGMSYTFGTILPAAGSTVVALPYGSWKLTDASGAVFAASTLQVVGEGSVAADGTVTLDPRQVAP